MPNTYTIYARTTGDDDTGDGSLGNPYRTFVRALRDVPINLGYNRYYLDISDLGVEEISNTFKFPNFIGGALDIVEIVGSVIPQLTDPTAVNIIATPTVLDTILNSQFSTTTVLDAYSSLVVVQLTDKTYTIDEFKGKFLTVSDDTDTYSAVIVSNTADTLTLASAVAPPTPDETTSLVIVEPSATLKIADAVTIPVYDNIAGINFNNVNNVGFFGIKLSVPSAQTSANIIYLNKCNNIKFKMSQFDIGHVYIDNCFNINLNTIYHNSQLILLHSHISIASLYITDDTNILQSDLYLIGGYLTDLYLQHSIDDVANIVVNDVYISDSNSALSDCDLTSLSITTSFYNELDNISLAYDDIISDRYSIITLDAIVYYRPERLIALVYGATIDLNASSGSIFTITATDNNEFVLNTPTNAVMGQCIMVTIINSSGGALHATDPFGNSAFKHDTWTQPADGYNRSISFYYNGSNWIESSRSIADIAN
jgi:hypothetical protein